MPLNIIKTVANVLSHGQTTRLCGMNLCINILDAVENW